MDILLEKKVAAIRMTFGKSPFYRELFRYIDQLRAEMSLISRGVRAAPVAQIQEENRMLKGALLNLVRLKASKDLHGKTEDYERLQPLAWKNAIAMLGFKMEDIYPPGHKKLDPDLRVYRG